MGIIRRFLLAPSLARLIEKERAGHHVTEGYFADQPRGSTCVRLEEGIGSLILVRHGSGEQVEEPTDLPRSQAEAMIAGVVRRHERVKGWTREGEPYHANDPVLLNWAVPSADVIRAKIEELVAF